ncbi:uncharacterized protein [Miscanthus floridulus]|uniref:uncharacterized protein n=1 Tax=Miscanthus floridulus TaxID=154761 RepID=UPI003457AD3A
MATIADEYYVPIHDACVVRARRRRHCKRALKLICCAIAVAHAVFRVLAKIDDNSVAKFSVDIASVEGLNGTTVVGARTVSPGFSLTARVENPRALTDWCSTGGQAVVSYAGVSLAWGPVPAFCVPKKGAAELTVAASGTGVGLSDDLRTRFGAEWNMGMALVEVEMKLFYDGNGCSWIGTSAYQGVSVVWRQLTLPGQGAPHAF